MPGFRDTPPGVADDDYANDSSVSYDPREYWVKRPKHWLKNGDDSSPCPVWLSLRPDPEDPFWWTSDAYNMMRPTGLIVTNAPKGALLHEWRTGNQRTLPYGSAPLTLATFEWLERTDALGLSKGQRPFFHTLELGVKLRLHVTTVKGKPLPETVGLTVRGIGIQ